MPNTLQIISPWLLDSLVSGNRGVSGSSSQIFTIFVGDVDSLIVSVALCESEINDVDVVPGGVSSSNQEIVRLDISMDQSLFVDFLNSLHQLNSNQKNCLEVKWTLARLE